MFVLPRHSHLWLPGYITSRIRAVRQQASETTDILFCIADHFEPEFGNVSPMIERERVCRWVREYPGFEKYRDSDGEPPRHTFFIPLEAYKPAIVDELSELCDRGLGEVEVHLHHGHDTSANLRARLEGFRDQLASRHGLLGTVDDRPAYAFVHGDWALDNGRLDASSCGVNDELTVLRETGCFADFTMPAAPDPAQSRIVNAIYYACDDPDKPRSYDVGQRVARNRTPPHDGLMMVQGPLALNWADRVGKVVPRIDNGALDASPRNHPLVSRFQRWLDAAITVEGKPEWRFIKVHSHGAKESNADVMLGPVAHEFHRAIGYHFNDGRKYRLHYVTAREMYNIAKAAEAGADGNPGQHRHYLVREPQRRLVAVRQF